MRRGAGQSCAYDPSRANPRGPKLKQVTQSEYNPSPDNSGAGRCQVQLCTIPGNTSVGLDNYRQRPLHVSADARPASVIHDRERPS